MFSARVVDLWNELDDSGLYVTAFKKEARKIGLLAFHGSVQWF